MADMLQKQLWHLSVDSAEMRYFIVPMHRLLDAASAAGAH